MDTSDPGTLERGILIHLLQHRGDQVRFEADQWVTEFGILRSFPSFEGAVVRQALRNLELSRWIYRRVQYVVGYSEPKLVYTLTPSGRRKAIDLQEEGIPLVPVGGGTAAQTSTAAATSMFNLRGVLTTDRRGDLDV